MRTTRRAMVGLLGGALALAALGPLPATAAGTQVGWRQHAGADGERDINVCSDAVQAGQARCFARRRTDSAAASHRPARSGFVRAASTLGNNGAYDPSYLESAYATPSAAKGVGQTVAVGTHSGTTYYYDVAATNSVGTGSASNEASAKAR